MATARKMRSRCCLQRLFARGAIETMFWRHCGWWNNSAVSGTRMSHLAQPSSHLLVRWEPWNRRMFRCQNDVEKYVRDVCSWSCSGDKSTETAQDLLRCDVFAFGSKLASAIHPQEARAKTAACSFRLAIAYFLTLRGWRCMLAGLSTCSYGFAGSSCLCIAEVSVLVDWQVPCLRDISKQRLSRNIASHLRNISKQGYYSTITVIREQ